MKNIGVVNIVSGLGIVLIFLISGCKNRNSPGKMIVINLRTEYLQSPMAVDVLHPRFTWNLSAKQRNIEQVYFQIEVTDSRRDLLNGRADEWDSGKVRSDNVINIPYDGKGLQSDRTYYWRVKVWNQHGVVATSKVAWFHTGLFHQTDWKGEWISAPDTSISAPLLRKVFSLRKPVRNATAFVTGLGFYRFYLNGKKVGDHVLDPGITNYHKRILYASYNVTHNLKEGFNAVGIMLGNGTWRLYKTKNRYHYRKQIFGPLRTLLQLNITFTDGTDTSIVTDTLWKYHSGPITYNNMYGGEDFDARKIQKDWSSPGFNDSGWKLVKAVEGPGGVLKSQMMPPIKVIETIKPVKQTHPEAGLYLYDLGQNIPGWWRIKVSGKRGLKLRIHGSETLDDSLFPKPLGINDRLSTKFKYHSQVYTDYTLNGDSDEIFEPGFFYTGFRYISVIVNHPEELTSLSVEGRVVETALKRTGTFSSSDSLINKIHHATVWAQIGNTHSYPSDCPTREKGAYTGDGQVVAESAMHDFDMAAFYTNWIADMYDAQQADGRIPNTAPQMLGGSGGGIPWGSAYILVPWWMHQYYGDTRILKKYYPSMKRYIEYLHNLARTDSNPKEKYIINNFDTYWYSLGEWCAPGENDGPNHPLVSTAYWYNDVMKFADIAQILGKKDDAKHYFVLADTIKKAFNKKFFDDKTNLYGTKKTYQTYLILALAFHLVPQSHRSGVLNELVNDIKSRHAHLDTGILGTKYMFPVLMDSGNGDLLYKIVTQKTYPGWGFWMEHGATTLWEHWSGKYSHNHQMFGSVDEYFYEYLAGIIPPTQNGTSAAYRKITIRPYFPAGLTSANGSIMSIEGKISSSWRKNKNSITLKVFLPANTQDTVEIPVNRYRHVEIRESGKTIWNNDKFITGDTGIHNGIQKGDYIVFSVGSGAYRFKISGANK